MEELELIEKEIIELLESKNYRQLKVLIEDVAAADIAIIFENMKREVLPLLF